MKQHKMSRTTTYHSWQAMLQRCRDPNCKDFKWYGARGVRVCKRWSNFRNFYADMGERPPGTSLDRTTGSRVYSKRTCRWANKFEQKHNRNDNIQLKFRNKTQPLAVWARELNMNFETLRHRLIRGWTPRRTLSTPVVQRANGSTYV